MSKLLEPDPRVRLLVTGGLKEKLGQLFIAFPLGNGAK
jgi:hypothetical protein